MRWFRHLEWVEGWPGAGDAIVWLDVRKADAAWRRNGLYVPAGAPEDSWKYDRFATWLKDGTEPIEMPHVTLRYWTLSFTNGRHRFAWLRDQGVEAIPVTTNPAIAKRTYRVLGSELRRCLLPLVQTAI